jgi:hypothetical protein
MAWSRTWVIARRIAAIAKLPELLRKVFRFYAFRQRHSAFLAFVDAKCTKRT